MKYLAFAATLLLVVPLGALAASWSPRVRSWMFTALVFTVGLGDFANINFWSLEMYRGPDRGFEVNLADLIAWALAPALVARLRGATWVAPYNSLWMLALFAVSLLSAALAPDGMLAGFTVWKLIRVYVIFWVAANAMRSDIPLRALWRGIVLAGVVMVLLALKQKYVDGTYRVPLTFDHSNTVPLYLNLMIPAALAFALGDRTLTRRAAMVTLVVALGMVFAVVSTYSRSGMVLAGGIALGITVLAAFRRPTSRAWIGTAVILAGLTVGGLMASRSIIERFENAPKSSQEARSEFNNVAAMMVNDHPLGVGLNNFSHVLTTTPKYKEQLEVMANEAQAGVGHHVYWLTAAETGWVGLVLFVIVLARFAGRAAWLGWAMRGRFEGLLQVAFLLGFAALHTAGFLEWAFRLTPVAYSFAWMAGVSVGLGRGVPGPVASAVGLRAAQQPARA